MHKNSKCAWNKGGRSALTVNSKGNWQIADNRVVCNCKMWFMDAEQSDLASLISRDKWSREREMSLLSDLWEKTGWPSWPSLMWSYSLSTAATRSTDWLLPPMWLLEALLQFGWDFWRRDSVITQCPDGRVNTEAQLLVNVCFQGLSIHSSICYSFSQSQQRHPDFNGSRNLLQLICRRLKAFPSQLRDTVPPECPGSSLRPLPGGKHLFQGGFSEEASQCGGAAVLLQAPLR